LIFADDRILCHPVADWNRRGISIAAGCFPVS